MSQPAVAVSATPDAVESAPSSVAVRRPQRGRGSSSGRRRRGRCGAERPRDHPRGRCSRSRRRRRHLRPGARSSTRSAAASTAGRWATTSTRLVRASVGDGVEEHLLGLLVEVRARLVEEHDGPAREHDAGERDAGPLAGREAGAVLAEGRVQAVRQGAARRRPGRRRPSAAHTSSSPRAGVPEADVGGDGVGEQPRSLRCPGDLVAPPRGVACGAGECRRRRRRRRRGASSPRSVASRVDLPQPDGPGDGDQPALGQVEVEGRGQGRVVADHEPVQRQRRRRAGRCEPSGCEAARASRASASARAAVPSAAAWNSAPDAAQRPVGLRREQQHGERDPEVDRPGRQPQPDGHRHQRDRQRGHQLEDRRRGEGDLERVDGRAAVAVGDRPDGADLRLGAPVRDQRRQAPHHVEEVARQRLQRAPLASGPGRGSSGRRATANTGTSGRVSATTSPDSGSSQVIAASVTTGSTGGRHQRREVAGDVGLDPGHAAGGEHRQAGGCDVRRCGVRPRAAGRGGRRRPRRPPGPPRAGRRTPSRCAAARARRATAAARPATVRRGDRGHHQGAEGERLRHRGQSAEDAAGRRRRRARPRAGRRWARTAAVERPHDAVALGRRGTGVGMWCTEMRLRKTQ